MHKLLVAVDSSACSIRALDYAIRLARENGPMALHLVHAHELPSVSGAVAIYMTLEKAKELQRQESEALLAPAVAMAKTAGIPFTSEILTGDIATVITECAERQGCDTIVMGTRGLGAIGNLMLGSIATKVVHLTKLPVTLVK